jgi:uroporphyrinogen decarboxylase
VNPRENALRIIRFDSPERVTGGPPGHGISYFGVDHQGWDNPRGHDVPAGSCWRDIWNVGWRKELDGVMGFAVEHPLAELRIEDYRWPDPDDPRICGPIFEKAKLADRATKFVTGSHRETLWERCYNLVGMARLMMAFYDAPDAVREILARVMDFQLGIARHYLDAGIEIASTGDDLGTQCGLLLGTDIVRQFLMPEYRRLFSLYKSRGVLINHHSCGHVEPILGDLMDLGVDILNPVQATANDLANVRRLTQGRMCLQGGVATALVMAGPVERIEAEVRRTIRLLGREGGYFCGPDQGMPFPQEHRNAFQRAVDRWGVYPLDVRAGQTESDEADR